MNSIPFDPIITQLERNYASDVDGGKPSSPNWPLGRTGMQAGRTNVGLRFQMTRQGMESMYTLAVRRLLERGAQDPMFSSPETGEDEVADEEAALLDAEVGAPGGDAHLEDARPSEGERERAQARRDLHLLWLGYSSF